MTKEATIPREKNGSRKEDKRGSGFGRGKNGRREDGEWEVRQEREGRVEMEKW